MGDTILEGCAPVGVLRMDSDDFEQNLPIVPLRTGWQLRKLETIQITYGRNAESYENFELWLPES